MATGDSAPGAVIDCLAAADRPAPVFSLGSGAEVAGLPPLLGDTLTVAPHEGETPPPAWAMAPTRSPRDGVTTEDAVTTRSSAVYLFRLELCTGGQGDGEGGGKHE